MDSGGKILEKRWKDSGKRGNSIDKNREKEYNDDVPVSVLTAGEGNVCSIGEAESSSIRKMKNAEGLRNGIRTADDPRGCAKLTERPGRPHLE